MERRLIFDVSTIAEWVDTPVGIVRIERALAARAHFHVRQVVLAVFDPNKGIYRELRDQWREAIIAGRAAIDPRAFHAARSRRQRRSERIPAMLRPLLRLRFSVLADLERLRLGHANKMPSKLIDILQRGLKSKQYARQMLHPDGARRDLIPHDLALGAAVALGPCDVLVCVGWQWIDDMAWLKARKAEAGFKFVLLCHDIMMLLWPHLFGPHRVNSFKKWIEDVFPSTDLIIFTTATARADAVRYCAARGIAIRSSRVVAPGVERLPRRAVSQLPKGIEAERYALYVSVLDRRKGHRLLYEVWLRLLGEGVPQRARFKLVLVGEPHGIEPELLHAIEHDARLGDTLKLLRQISDYDLADLYSAAAFCLFPSLYEGYGLSIVEAFDHGKAVIASTGGALPEVVAGLSPCLDPVDAEAWYATLKAWIVSPAERLHYEEAIKATFRHPDWDAAATTFFNTIEAEIAASD